MRYLEQQGGQSTVVCCIIRKNSDLKCVELIVPFSLLHGGCKTRLRLSIHHQVAWNVDLQQTKKGCFGRTSICCCVGFHAVTGKHRLHPFYNFTLSPQAWYTHTHTPTQGLCGCVCVTCYFGTWQKKKKRIHLVAFFLFICIY